MVLVSTQKLEFCFILVSPKITYIAPLKTLDIDHRDLKKTLGLDFTELVTLSKKPDTSRITGALNCHAITLDQWLWLRQKIIIQLMKFTWYSFYWMGKKCFTYRTNWGYGSVVKKSTQNQSNEPSKNVTENFVTRECASNYFISMWQEKITFKLCCQ